MLVQPPPPTSRNGLYPHDSFKPRARLKLSVSGQRPSLHDLMGGLLVLLVIAVCALTAFAAVLLLLWALSRSLGFLVQRLGG